MSRPFAVFDIDGTVTRWQFLHAMIDAFAKHGFISAEAYQPVREARMTWKKRAHHTSFTDYEMALINAFIPVLPQIPPERFRHIADEVFETYKDQTYVYTRTLISDLKQKDYLLFVISGSPTEIVAQFAAYYGFDDYAGSEHHQKQGKFTGEVTVQPFIKHQTLRTLIATHHAGYEGSIGVGDTKGDIPMLEMVERPIAFNPDAGLYEHARRQGWDIVVERKSVIYELRSHDGNYLLA